MSWKYDDTKDGDANERARQEAASKNKAAFLVELRVLLAKYHAEIEAEDHYRGWPECGGDIRMTVTFEPKDIGWHELNLGRTVDQTYPV